MRLDGRREIVTGASQGKAALVSLTEALQPHELGRHRIRADITRGQLRASGRSR
jgi:hypothetical protein